MTDYGFTGTQLGMTSAQLEQLLVVLQMGGATRGRHGDCVGADEQFHTICRFSGLPVTLHPPLDSSKRAFCDVGPHYHSDDNVKPRADYYARNRHIVRACEHLIAGPAQEQEVPRSGTWVTVRAARRFGRAHTIIYPSGRIEHG